MSETIGQNELQPQYQKLFLKAMSAVEMKNHGYAVNLLQTILKESPGFLEGRELLRAAAVKDTGGHTKKKGLSLGGPASKIKGMIKKDAHGAMVEAEKHLGEDPYNVDLNEVLFDAALAAAMPKTAAFALETVREAHKDKAVSKILYKLAELYEKEGQNDDASKVYSDISQRDPADGEASKKARDTSARASMKKGGWDASSQGGVDFREMLRNEDEAKKLEAASRTGMTAEQMDEQLAILGAEYEANPNNLDVVRKIADLYERKEDWASAQSYYEWAFSLSQSDGTLQRKVEKMADAVREQGIKNIEAEIAAGGLDEVDLETKKEQLSQMRREQSGQRIDEARARVERNPTDPQLRFELAQYLFDAEEYTDAIPELQRAKTNPALRIKAIIMLGKCCEKKHMYDISVSHFKEAIGELHGMDQVKKDALYNLGLVYEAMDNKSDALECFKEIYNNDYGFRDVAKRVESSYSAA
ncbi:MAG: tetratricopeptide repeat protein [Verrucomicrobiota bacterium]